MAEKIVEIRGLNENKKVYILKGLYPKLTKQYLSSLERKIQGADGEDEVAALYYLVKAIREEIKFIPCFTPKGETWIKVS